MKTFTKQIAGVLFATLALCSQVFAQQSLFGIRLQDANSHVLTIGSPTTGFTGSYNFRFPAAVPAAGGLLYASDGIGQSSWLPAGTTGQVLSFSAGGLPVWSNLSSLLTGLIEWDISGNSLVAAYNGIIGSYLGTSNNQPLVLATTNILTPEPIEFFTNNTEKMRLTSGGELGIGLTPAAGKLLHVAGTSGTSNVRLASLASATGTTGRLMFATDATGDLQDLAFPASSGQVLSSTTGGVLSWTTPTSGTVTSVSVTTANGVSGVVANPTTTPAITLTLGAITPSSVASTGAVSGTNLSGTNTGDVTLAGTGTYLSLAGQVLTQNPIDLSTANASGVLAAGRFPALTGDVTTVAGALASTIQPAAVTLAKMANLAANSIIGNNTGVGATPIALTTAQVKTMLNLTGTNSGDVSLGGENYLSIAGQVITANAVNLSGTNVTSILPETKGGTNQSTYTLGDMLYSSAANTLSKLAGNTVATKKFLTQTGTGAVSAAPAWNAIAAADVPVMVASGASHAPGIVPDPGAVAGATKYLREDGTWVNPGASTGWALGGNNLPASNIFGTTSATNVMMQANSTQTLQLTGVATANYDVGSVLLGTTATPIVSTGDKLVINGGNFSLNSETNGAITREIVFRGTAGSGNLRIRGDGNDLYWQGGGGKNLQMGAYWQINLLGQLQTAALQPLSANSTFAHVYIPLSQTADAGLVIQNASGQTADPFQIQAFNATQGSGSILAKVTSGGNMLLGASGAQLQLQGTGTGISTFQSGAQGATNFNYTLPTTIPTVNQVLTATAVAAPNVTLGWTSAGGGSVAGANTQVQYNNSGAFGASANFTYDGTTLQSTTSSTTDAIAAIKGSVTGNGGANGELNGVWGIASSATQGANTNAGTGVRAEGNNTTTDANSNIALHVINGEFVVGRQASSAASDNSNGNNILVANEDDIDGLTDQGPSGIVDVTDGGNPVAGGPTTNSLQVFNRYAKAHSIILITPMTGGTGAEGVNETATFQISGRANGSFNIDVRRVHPNGAAGTSGTWRVGFLIINPGK